MPKPHLYLLAALLAAAGLSHFSDRIDPYHLDVLTGIGINIILAVSLNLVNGYTGQFSLGHAGFMSVGAYLAAAVSLFLGPKILGAEGGTAVQQGFMFLAALVAGFYAIDWLLGRWLAAAERRHDREVAAYDALQRWYR